MKSELDRSMSGRDGMLGLVLDAQTLTAACEAAAVAALQRSSAHDAGVALRQPDGLLRLGCALYSKGGPLMSAGAVLDADNAILAALEGTSSRLLTDRCLGWRLNSTAHTTRPGSLAVAPVWADGERLGALVMSAPQPDALTEAQLPSLTIIAKALGLRLAILNGHDRLTRLRQLYAALRASNRLLIGSEHTAEQLYAKACEVCVREAGFSLAWIAGPDEEGWFRTLACAGPAANLVNVIRVSTRADRTEGWGSMGQAWREARAVYLHTPLAESRYRHWHSALAAHGVHAFASVPLTRRSRVVAVLAVGAPEPGFFGDDERVLFEEIGADLSEALSLLGARVRAQLAATAVEHAATGIMVADAKTQRVLYSNGAMTALTGFSTRELAGRTGLFFMPQDPTGQRLPGFRGHMKARQHWSGAVWGRRGERLWEASVRVRHVTGPDRIHRLVALFGPPPFAPDESLRDELTGLPNAKGFQQLLEQRLANAGEHGLVLVRANVDDLTAVNSAHGRRGGDRILSELAQRLRRALPISTAVARLKGDDFAILPRPLRRDALPRAAQIILRKVEQALVEPFEVDGHGVPLRVALGVALHPNDISGDMALMERADAALEHTRTEYAKSRVRRAGDGVATRERLATAARLRRDLHGGNGIHPWYQPKVRLADGVLIGAEALARWRDPKHGLTSPGVFLPLAQAMGLTVMLNNSMLAQALADLAAWREGGFATMPVSVNLSPEQFVDVTLVDQLKHALFLHRLPPSLLHVEITEHALITGIDTARSTLSALADAGIGVSLDDFGTGYSSLSMLRDLPLSRLKLDKTFVDRLPDDRRTLKVAKLVIELAHSLDMSVIAEGIEHIRQVELLCELGCDFGQGFLFSKPLPADEFRERWLAPGRPQPR